MEKNSASLERLETLVQIPAVTQLLGKKEVNFSFISFVNVIFHFLCFSYTGLKIIGFILSWVFFSVQNRIFKFFGFSEKNQNILDLV